MLQAPCCMHSWWPGLQHCSVSCRHGIPTVSSYQASVLLYNGHVMPRQTISGKADCLHFCRCGRLALNGTVHSTPTGQLAAASGVDITRCRIVWHMVKLDSLGAAIFHPCLVACQAPPMSPQLLACDMCQAGVLHTEPSLTACHFTLHVTEGDRLHAGPVAMASVKW